MLFMTYLRKRWGYNHRFGVKYIYRKGKSGLLLFRLSGEKEYKRLLDYNRVNLILTKYYHIFSLSLKHKIEDNGSCLISAAAIPIANTPNILSEVRDQISKIFARSLSDSDSCALKYNDYTEQLTISYKRKEHLADMIFPFNKIIGAGKSVKNKEKIVLGVDQKGDTVCWRPTLDQSHMLVAGMTGSGKTSCMQSIVLQAIIGDYMVMVCDPKSVDFFSFKEHVKCAFTKEQIEQVITSAFSTMEDRYKLRNLHDTPVLVVIDEFREVLSIFEKNKEILNMVNRIAFKGRAARVFLCIGIQRPDASLISGFMRDNFGYRVNFKMMSQSSYRMMWSDSKIDTASIEKFNFSPGIAIAGTDIPKFIKTLYIENIEDTLRSVISKKN